MALRFFKILGLAAALLLGSLPAFCCTSIIVSGRVRPDGKALMFKHRDSSNPHNAIEAFSGEKYTFLALVNADWRSHPVAWNTQGIPEVWAGRNEAGFSIMNTATYDLKDDEVPASEMDREGLLMYRALSICSTLSDFEHFLDTLRRPLGVEANFGVIDEAGGAAYYEVNNHKWIKWDVNACASGYMVVTNFSRSGRVADRKGEDRFQKACQILADTDVPVSQWDHRFLIERISRSGKPILRDISSAVIVFESGQIWACAGPPNRVPCLRYYLEKGRVKSTKKA